MPIPTAVLRRRLEYRGKVCAPDGAHAFCVVRDVSDFDGLPITSGVTSDPALVARFEQWRDGVQQVGGVLIPVPILFLTMAGLPSHGRRGEAMVLSARDASIDLILTYEAEASYLAFVEMLKRRRLAA
ncbi:MAG: hypothetical protein VYE22_41050 [Myxococcota bacterium]|nr:hypothetical protein [Myxococcota bacterium]